MSYTDESWFVNFYGKDAKDRARRTRAQVTTSNGGVILDIYPNEHALHTNSEELRDAFVDNARIAGAGRLTMKALEQLLDWALENGLDAESAIAQSSVRAIKAAKPDITVVTYDGVEKFRGTENEGFEYILRHQGQSVDYALKHGGWAFVPAAEYDQAHLSEQEASDDASQVPGM